MSEETDQSRESRKAVAEKLEPEATKMRLRRDNHELYAAGAIISLAISAKRIADALDELDRNALNIILSRIMNRDFAGR